MITCSYTFWDATVRQWRRCDERAVIRLDRWMPADLCEEHAAPARERGDAYIPL